MQISTEELEGGVTRVILDGRLDIVGAQEIDLKMNVIAGTKKLVLIDMQKLSFIGSMSLRTLVIPAQAIKGSRRQARFVRPERNGRKCSEIQRHTYLDSHLP